MDSKCPGSTSALIEIAELSPPQPAEVMARSAGKRDPSERRDGALVPDIALRKLLILPAYRSVPLLRGVGEGGGEGGRGRDARIHTVARTRRVTPSSRGRCKSTGHGTIDTAMPLSDQPRRCPECEELTPHREMHLRSLLRVLRLLRKKEWGWICQRCECRERSKSKTYFVDW